MYWPLLLLMVLGFWRCLRDRSLWRPEWMSLHLALLATVATAMIFCGLARFRDANVSLLMIYAVLGWEGVREIWQRNQQAPSKEAVPAAAGAR